MPAKTTELVLAIESSTEGHRGFAKVCSSEQRDFNTGLR